MLKNNHAYQFIVRSLVGRKAIKSLWNSAAVSIAHPCDPGAQEESVKISTSDYADFSHCSALALMDGQSSFSVLM